MGGKIFAMIGTPSEAEINKIPDEKIRQRLKKYRHQDRRSFGKEMPYIDPAGINLLEAMLQFMPEKRMSMAAVVKEPFFRRARRGPDEEKRAGRPVETGLKEANPTTATFRTALNEQI